MCNTILGLLQLKTLNKCLETLTIFCKINRVGGCTEDRDASGFKTVCKLQRGLSAELNDHTVQGAVLLLNAQDFHDMFKCQRLKIEAIRRVIIR